MADFYERMRGVSVRLLAPTNEGGLGQGTIELVRFVPGAPGPDPWSPPAEPTRQVTSLNGAARGVTKEMIGAPVENGGQIIATDLQVILAPWGGSIEPTDILEVDGAPVTILSISNIPGAGTVCAIRVIVRS